MFAEFIECTEDKDGNETVTIVCGDCVLQVTLEDFRDYVKPKPIYGNSTPIWEFDTPTWK